MTISQEFPKILFPTLISYNWCLDTDQCFYNFDSFYNSYFESLLQSVGVLIELHLKSKYFFAKSMEFKSSDILM